MSLEPPVSNKFRLKLLHRVSVSKKRKIVLVVSFNFKVIITFTAVSWMFFHCPNMMFRYFKCFLKINEVVCFCSDMVLNLLGTMACLPIWRVCLSRVCLSPEERVCPFYVLQLKAARIRVWCHFKALFVVVPIPT